METKWNTGRLYTLQGQTIYAAIATDGLILFADLSRGIYGEISATIPSPCCVIQFRNIVMKAYDANAYRATHRAAQYEARCRETAGSK